MALAYCHYIGSGCEKWKSQKVDDFLKENGLAETIAFLPFDEDDKDPNSEKYKEKRANYIEEKNAEIAELEKRADKNDLIATFELALEYNSESDTESRKKAYELFKKTVYIFDHVEYEYVSEENSWKRLKDTGEALYFLGKYLNEGRLEDENPEKARACFMQGMFYGNDSCAYELARLSERGYWSGEAREYKQDMDFALRCYQVAAKKGNWLAKSALEDYNIKVEEENKENSHQWESNDEDDEFSDYPDELPNKSFIVSRKGSEVAAVSEEEVFDNAKILSQTDRKDPTSVLVSFFVSYFSKGEEWHDLIAHYSFPGSSFDEGIAAMNEAWEGFYGKVDSVRVTINPSSFKSNGDGRALYTVNIAASYQGESDEGEDQVAMTQDENGNWLVAELPM